MGTVCSSSDSFDESSDESTEYRSDEETVSLWVSFPPFLLLYILPCVKSLQVMNPQTFTELQLKWLTFPIWFLQLYMYMAVKK